MSEARGLAFAPVHAIAGAGSTADAVPSVAHRSLVGGEFDATARPGGVLLLDHAEFGRKVDQRDFAFDHRLCDDALFDLDRLRRLAGDILQQRPRDLYFDAGSIGPSQRWTDMGPGGLTVFDAFDRIGTADAWIILRRAHLDPNYAGLLESCMADILRAGGPEMARQMVSQEALIIITSPRRVTAFHIDRECGFLLQVRGNKAISLFNREDREVLPEEEIELFWTRDNNAPRYRPQLQDRATVYRLQPGCGVHIPVNAPHWIQNGDNISVSVNINFAWPEARRGHLYRANYQLRQFGLTPTPPFQSPLRDRLKMSFGAATFAARNAYRESRSLLRGKR
jgi:hypothetical protein